MIWNASGALESGMAYQQKWNEDSDTPTYPLKIAFKSQITHVGTSALCFFVGLKRSSREEHDLSLSLSPWHTPVTQQLTGPTDQQPSA